MSGPVGIEAPVHIGLAEAWTIARMQHTTILTVAAVVLALGTLGTLLLTPEYESTAVVQLRQQVAPELNTERVGDGEIKGWKSREVFNNTQLDLLRSRTLMEDIITRLGARGVDDPAGTMEGPDALLEFITVRIRDENELVDITVTHPDAQLAADIANETAEAFRSANLDASRDAARDALIWLEKQIAEYGGHIDSSSAQIVQYQADHDLADVEMSITAQTAEMESLSRAYGSTNTEIVALESQIRVHEQLFRDGKFVQLSKTLETPLVEALTETYATAVTENASLAARYQESHPERQSGAAKLARIEAEVRDEVTRTISSEKARLAGLVEERDSYVRRITTAKAEMLEKQRVLDGYDRLRVELERSSEQLKVLHQRQDELDLQARTQLSNVRIVDPALPAKWPSSPNLILNLALSVVMGLGLGCAVGFVREYLDDSIATRADVEAFLRVPYLGQVGRIVDSGDTGDRALYTHRHPNCAEAEAMRTIRTILDSNASGVPRCILVTSAVMSEGKTETSLRLAVAFSNLGRRVLVVDGDLRRPRVHRVFGMDRSPGLTDALAGHPLAMVARPTSIPGIDVLPVGRDSIRAVEHLSNPQMRTVLQSAVDRYDLVIVDSSPAGVTADAAMLAKLTDGVVFVVKQASGSRRAVQQAVWDLQSAGAQIIGTILNGVERKHGTSYAYRYAYSYDDHGVDAPGEHAAK